MANEITTSSQECGATNSLKPASHRAIYHAVTKQRWSLFQKRELQFWKQQGALKSRLSYAHRYYLPLLKPYANQEVETSSVLEIGSGPICTARHLHGSDFTYIDPLLDAYRRLFPGVMPEGATYMTAMAEDVVLERASYDLIICLNTLSDVLNPELVLNNVERALKPEGLFLVTIDIWPTWLARAHFLMSRLAPTLPRLNRLYSYTHKGFENSLSRHFHIVSEHRIQTPLKWLSLRQECYFVCEHLDSSKG